jgi:hypothetical protein
VQDVAFRHAYHKGYVSTLCRPNMHYVTLLCTLCACNPFWPYFFKLSGGCSTASYTHGDPALNSEPRGGGLVMFGANLNQPGG